MRDKAMLLPLVVASAPQTLSLLTHRSCPYFDSFSPLRESLC